MVSSFVFKLHNYSGLALRCDAFSQAVPDRSVTLFWKAILKHPDAMNSPNVIGKSALRLSVDCMEGMVILFENGTDIDAGDALGLMQVAYAVLGGHTHAVTSLVEAGCKLHLGNITWYDSLPLFDHILSHMCSCGRSLEVKGSARDLLALKYVINNIVERVLDLQKLTECMLPSGVLCFSKQLLNAQDTADLIQALIVAENCLPSKLQ